MAEQSTWESFVDNLGVWKREGVKAPHKPLMLLWLLARAQSGAGNSVHFSEVDGPLVELLRDYGPRRKSYHPEYPFWYLQDDGFWVVRDPDKLKSRKDKAQPLRSEFMKHDAVGYVPEPMWLQLQSDPILVSRLAGKVLTEFWPETLHRAILSAVDLKLSLCISSPAPASGFRDSVLRAYEGQCAFCGYDGMLGATVFGLEAAHIRWRARGGPDVVPNAMALCSLHHVAFDRGAVSLAEDNTLLVSQDTRGTSDVVREWVVSLAGHPLRPPQSTRLLPSSEYTEWHRTNVFRAPARDAG